MRYLVLTGLFFLILSCQSAPSPDKPDWARELPLEDGKIFVLYTGEMPPAEEDYYPFLAEKLLSRMGIQSTVETSALYEAWTLLLVNQLKDEDLSNFSILNNGAYLEGEKTFLALLAAMDEDYYNSLLSQWIPQVLESRPELDEMEETAESFLDQGWNLSAFFAFADALAAASLLDSSTAAYRIQKYRERAMESLALMEDIPLEGPERVYSGEGFSEPFTIDLPMESDLGDSLLFQVYYPHSMDPHTRAEAKVWSESDGSLRFFHPPVFQEGDYTIEIRPDRDYLMLLLALEEDSPTSELDTLLDRLSWTKTFTVEMDFSRLPLYLLIEDKDVLNKVLEDRESARKLDVLLSNQGISVETLQAPLSAEGISERQLLREVLLTVNDQNALLLYGSSQITNYQIEGNRVTISGSLEYKIQDLRTFKVIKQGRLEKQLDFDNPTAALPGLYTQLARELAAIYQGL